MAWFCAREVKPNGTRSILSCRIAGPWAGAEDYRMWDRPGKQFHRHASYRPRL